MTTRQLCLALALGCLAFPSAAQAGDWAMFHHDIAHGGGTSETTINATSATGLTAGPTFTSGSAIYTSPAVVKDTTSGHVIAYFGTLGGAVQAVDETSGAQRWLFQTGAKVNSSPAVVGNVVYVGSADHRLYALNRTTGAKICSYLTTGRIEASPLAVNGVVYVGDEGPTGYDDGGSMWAINASNCTLKWRYKAWGATPGTQPKVGVWSPAAYATTSTGRHLVIFGSGSPEGAVYALDASTGTRVWRFQTQQFAADEDVGAGPTISAPGSIFPSGAAYVSGKDNIAYALNLATGAKLWQFSIRADQPASYSSGEPRTTAALSGGRLFLGWGQGLYALEPKTGARIWSSKTINGATAEIISSPAVSGPAGNQVVISGDVNGTLYAWNAQTGSKIWSRALGNAILGSTAIAYGSAYITDAGGKLWRLHP